MKNYGKKLIGRLRSLRRNLIRLGIGLGMSLSLSLSVVPAYAQQAASSVASLHQGAAADVWNHRTRRLTSSEIDALLAQPDKLLVLDVRRPDELTARGGFPVYLNIQTADVPGRLAYIPRDRIIVTVSNRAHRAGDVGDLLIAKGYNVAGAAGTLDYEEQGGRNVVRISPPPPKTAVAR